MSQVNPTFSFAAKTASLIKINALHVFYLGFIYFPTNILGGPTIPCGIQTTCRTYRAANIWPILAALFSAALYASAFELL